MGFTLLAARTLQVLDDSPRLSAYLDRITRRDAFTATLATLPF